MRAFKSQTLTQMTFNCIKNGMKPLLSSLPLEESMLKIQRKRKFIHSTPAKGPLRKRTENKPPN